MSNLTSSFYIIAHEAGAENSAIPCWANRDTNPATLDPDANAPVERHEIENVPGAFQLLPEPSSC
jgi:predicted protein tyrosine phosphatase